MTTDATRAHIDAETLAAWAEHGLSAEAAAGVELHLSHCDRCQEMLAAFVRSEPAAGAVILPFWTRRPVQWSAAGLAAAAALVAFVWIGRPPALPTPDSMIAQAPIDAIAPSAPAELRADKPAPQPSSKALREVESKKESARVAAEPVAAPRPVAAPPPPPPPAASQRPVMPPPVTVSAAAPVPVVTVGGTAAGNVQVASRAESVLRDEFRSIEIVAPDPSIAAARTVAGGAGRGGGGRAALNQVAVPARWRVLAGTHVERSLDAGATWNALSIEPSLTAPLIAGTATSQLVCWLVGGDGVVLVTTDGQTFRRVSLPESIRLTGVTAIDGLRATVSAADGRKFTTVDGGLTWK